MSVDSWTAETGGGAGGVIYKAGRWVALRGGSCVKRRFRFGLLILAVPVSRTSGQLILARVL